MRYFTLLVAQKVQNVKIYKSCLTRNYDSRSENCACEESGRCEAVNLTCLAPLFLYYRLGEMHSQGFL